MNQYFSELDTERLNPATSDIDMRSTIDILRCINEEDKKVPYAVEQCLPEIAAVVDVICDRMKHGGRLLYFGAGTSGRLGVLDASECIPTFGVSNELVQAYIAGGDRALRTPVEGCEDSASGGASDVTAHHLTENDVVVGISASGSAMYVVGVLDKARQAGAYTVAIVNNKNSKLKEYADTAIELATGPEVISGSTRMKAGTSQKLVLNMLTTASMIRLGKVYNNLMVDLKASNHKLKERAVRIVCEVTGISEIKAEEILIAAGMDTKLAILMELSGKRKDECVQLLKVSDGFLRDAIDRA